VNCRLVDARLDVAIRKPFDVLAEGLLIPSSRGDRTPIEHFVTGLRLWAGTQLLIQTCFALLPAITVQEK
jgi:hypothetical protein